MRIYSIYDKKSLKYGPLMTFNNDVMCIRSVEMDMNTSTSIIGAYPHDFCVVCFGEFNPDDGVITPFAVAENIYECANFISRD